MERFDDSEKALSWIFYQIGTSMGESSLCLPFAVSTLKRLQANVRSPVDGKCPGDGESFSTAWKLACIRFYGRKFTLEAG